MMKKTIFTALLSFLYLFPAFSSASCKEDEIEIYRITDATTRSLTALPEASIDAQSGQLSVSFDSGGSTPTTSPVSARGCSAWLLKDPAGNMKDISAFINSNF